MLPATLLRVMMQSRGHQDDPHMRKLLLAATTSTCLFGPVASAHDAPGWLGTGSNEILRLPLPGAQTEDLEVIVSDVLLPPDATLPPHTHPGQEYVYVIEGEVLHREDGKPDTLYKAGDRFVIEAGAVHSPQNTSTPARAIVFRLHPEGEPARTIVAEDWEQYAK